MEHITLSTLAARISSALAGGSLDGLWVVATVAGVSVNRSGHCYLELTESAEGSTAPVAAARAAVWNNRWRIVEPYFRSVTGGTVAVGQRLLVKCSVTFHALYGLSLVVTDIDPTYTVGEVEAARRATIDRLTREGVVGMNGELELDAVVQRLAVVSSPTAAGWGDFMNEIAASPIAFHIQLFEAAMQGEGAPASIMEALDSVAEQAQRWDAVVIIRGGGSSTDLACFDNYDLCNHIAQFPLPVITGIGHERDTPAADIVAHTRCKTPTAVAAFLASRGAEFLERLERARSFVAERSQQILLGESNRMERASLVLKNTLGEILARNNAAIASLESRLRLGVNNLIAQHTAHRATLAERLRTTTAHAIAAEHHRLELLGERVASHNPRRILAMGYAIVGGGIKSVAGLERGSEITVELADGTIDAEIVRINS